MVVHLEKNQTGTNLASLVHTKRAGRNSSRMGDVKPTPNVRRSRTDATLSGRLRVETPLRTRPKSTDCNHRLTWNPTFPTAIVNSAGISGDVECHWCQWRTTTPTHLGGIILFTHIDFFFLDNGFYFYDDGKKLISLSTLPTIKDRTWRGKFRISDNIHRHCRKTGFLTKSLEWGLIATS